MLVAVEQALRGSPHSAPMSEGAQAAIVSATFDETATARFGFSQLPYGMYYVSASC